MATTPDFVCPVACGECCEYWKDLLYSEPEFFPGLTRENAKDMYDCPNLTEEGCRLPRAARPPGCLGFSCEMQDYQRSKSA